MKKIKQEVQKLDEDNLMWKERKVRGKEIFDKFMAECDHNIKENNKKITKLIKEI